MAFACLSWLGGGSKYPAVVNVSKIVCRCVLAFRFVNGMSDDSASVDPATLL